MNLLILQMMITGAATVSFIMLVLWFVATRIKNAGLVDLGWVLGLIILAATYGVEAPGNSLRKFLILVLVGVGGLRLAIHLLVRFIYERKEDSRYQNIREEWKTSVDLKFFLFFQFQALVAVILSVPFLLICLNFHQEITNLEFLGIVVWSAGFLGEMTADEQLRSFKRSPFNRGKVCQEGLWNYSRHPNYFFEWVIWVGYFVFALGSPWGWLSIVSPLLMLYFLLMVSGVPLAEAQSLRSRGEAYRQYQRTTSVFVPWFKKNEQ